VKVALYGGSFNPPHVAHQMVALYVLETAVPAQDQIWLVPTFKHPFDKSLVSFEHRFAMCEAAAAALGPRARVDDVEARLGGDSVTLRTVEKLQAEHPDAEFSLVIGADLAREVDSWYQAERLRRLLPIIVVGRTGAPGAASVGVDLPAVSSTRVRAALVAGHDDEARKLVPRGVFDYIRAHHLYRDPQPGETPSP